MFQQNLCTRINSTTPVLKGGDQTSTVRISFFTKTYTQPPTPTSRDFITEYYFQDSYTLNINNISYTNDSINDYCLGHYPITRAQRYRFCASSNTATCNLYQVWSGCPLRDGLQYSTIPDNFFTSVLPASTDDPINFSDFTNATNGTCMFFQICFFLFICFSLFL